MIGDSLLSTDGKVLGSDESIKLGLSVGNVIATILGGLYRIKIGLDIIIELGSLDGSFDGSNDGNVGGLLLFNTASDLALSVRGMLWQALFQHQSQV